MTPSTDDWLRRIRPASNATHRLVCFPHAGGSASFFRWIFQMLPTTTEVLGVQYPGRQDRRSEPLIPTISGLADQVHEVLGSRLDRPTAFFGHSMGAVVAFEVARRLTASGPGRRGGPGHGGAPAVLFVSGCQAPPGGRRAPTLR
ncbi:thioesterase domain-containing protein [Frankia sp. Cppng1_Ct_nod]|uniref:thioesterase II family protein n=1 Tax=Frankia sp. Cppng1_Ct_nod TaxID=2897162 RepID=UPI002024411D|nr:thioesterase domain-containing protein [Frankia sp. Cppng1_Ct_nod]